MTSQSEISYGPIDKLTSQFDNIANTSRRLTCVATSTKKSVGDLLAKWSQLLPQATSRHIETGFC